MERLVVASAFEVVTLAIEELEIAGRALEGREATRTSSPALQPAASVEGGDGGRRPDDTTQ